MFRTLVALLIVAAVLLALLAAAAFSPITQTWAVEYWLNRQPGVTATVGEVAAGFSSLEVTDLKISRHGAVLRVPSAEISLPVLTALKERRLDVQRLAAKGWTLEVRPTEGAAAAPGKAAVTSDADAPAPVGWLAGWALPVDLSIDGVVVEGDVVVYRPGVKEPWRAHGTIKGGGLRPAARGEFAIEGIVSVPESGRWPEAYGVDGKVMVSLATPRTVGQLGYEGRVTARGDTFPDDLRFSAAVVAAEGKPETYDLAVLRAGRRMAQVNATAAGAPGGWRGRWELDLRDSDVAGLWPMLTFPTGSAQGRGEFRADSALTRVTANGHWRGEITAWGAGLAGLGRLGAVTFNADVDAEWAGAVLRLERGEIEVNGTRPIARLRSVQPWRYDAATGAMTAADPAADWFEGTMPGVPVGLFSEFLGGVELAGGDLSGDFLIGPAPEGFVVRAKTPWVASGVAATRQGRALAGGLEVSVAGQVRHSPRGWLWQLAPLRLAAAGRRLAQADLTVMPLGERTRFALVNGTWELDLDGWARQPVLAERGPLPGRSAAGSVNASLGTTTEVTSKLTITGHEATRTLAADVQVQIGAQGDVSGRVPLTFTAGKESTELAVAGTWRAAEREPRMDLRVDGVSVDLAPLKAVAGGWLARQGLPWLQTAAPALSAGPAPGRDVRPWWGDWRGEVTINCYQLRVAPYDFTQLSGVLTGDGRAVRLRGGKATVMPPAEPPPDPKKPRPSRGPEIPRRQVALEGEIAFDAGVEQPYRLEAAGAIDVVEFSDLFGFSKPPPAGVLEGRVAVTANLTGRGNTLPALVEQCSTEYRITGRNGVARLLQATIADGITEDKPSAMGDALAGAGSLLGTVLGLGRDSIHTGARNLPKATEAVLNFTYQLGEFRYDDLVVTARRGPDGTVAVTEFALTAPQVRLQGTGRMTPVEAQPPGRAALELEMTMGVRGTWAAVLGPAELLAATPDAAGYTPFREPVRLSGTPERIENPAWRELLLKAAVAPLAKGKK